jgi:hypothetical protein
MTAPVPVTAERPFPVFLMLYAPLAMACGCLLAFPAIVATGVVTAIGFLAYLGAAARAAAGPGQAGVAGLLEMRRHRLRHTAGFALAATATQAALLTFAARMGTVSPGLFTPAALLALYALHLAAGWLVIGRAACTLAALRRAFAAENRSAA